MHRRSPRTITVIAWLASALWFALPALADGPSARTAEELHAAAETAATGGAKVRILIVPGHEPSAGGTAFGKLKERDLAAQLGKDLQRYLAADGRFEVFLSRDEHGWDPAVAAVFASRWDEIDAWSQAARAEWEALVASGRVAEPPVPVRHRKAPHPMGVRLYGITKWANENGIDLMVHIHFDDDRASSRYAGRRAGFAIYAPPPQYANGPASLAVAEKLLPRLAAFDPVAKLGFVGRGIVRDPQLIALGRWNSAYPASVLTEYAFIYERQLRTQSVRALALDDMAYRTFLGLRDFFYPGEPAARATSVLPHDWKTSVRAGSDPADVYALQTALMVDGDLPPAGKTKSACPRNGLFGPCTSAALKAFQAKYGITGEAGFAGAKTVAKLRAF
ncbi:MAG TPA: peptidoglycan-binding protein [Candidatus Binatia bacterium]|jgi:N-acetylmuramoyl-L-alanine amidase|nr:peptidoglycan-binding protein [Candidatus Binatia bacterium]